VVHEGLSRSEPFRANTAAGDLSALVSPVRMGLWDWIRGRGPRGARELEPIIAALANGGGAEVRRRFFAAFAESRLIVPSPGLEAAGVPMNARVEPQRDVKINVVGSEAPDGSKGLVAFTSEKALLAWRPVGCPYVELRAPDIVSLALRSDLRSIIVNPAGPVGGYVSYAELTALAEGADPAAPAATRTLPADSFRVTSLRRAASPDFLAAIAVAARNLAEVEAIWFVELTIGRGAPHPAIIIQHVPGASPDQFVPPIMTTVQGFLGHNEYVDCLPLARGRPLLDQARAAGSAVFERETSPFPTTT
jgi:hypothetical protein